MNPFSEEVHCPRSLFRKGESPARYAANQFGKDQQPTPRLFPGVRNGET